MNDFKPDFSRMRKVLMREGEPDCVPFYDLFADPEIVRAVTGKPASIENAIEFQCKMGYDYAGAGVAYFYQRKMKSTEDSAQLSRGKRSFVDDNHGMIENRRGFNKYRWPEVTDSVAGWANETIRKMPEGMKLILSMPGGILENVMWLMGYIPFSYAIYDDEQLVSDLFEIVGTDFVNALRITLLKTDIKQIGAVVMGDDMGYNHATMISPELLRKYVFPWQKRIVDIVHSYDIPFILHSCGNLEEVMDDLIEYVGIDAKQSFENKIMPVAEAKKRYGKRIALLGGADVNCLATMSVVEVHEYVRKILLDCAPGGGYALGTGNTVTNYIPLQNYIAMQEEGRKTGIYPIK